MPSAYQVFLGPENRNVTIKLIQYSLLMFSAPIAVFYATLHGIFGGDLKMIGWCGIAAVVAANMVIVSYVVMAWNEKDPEGDKELEKRAAVPPKAYRVD